MEDFDIRKYMAKIRLSEDEDQKIARAQFDLAIKPVSIDDALTALDNVDNYGMYAQNMRKSDVITKVFGPSIPAQKTKAAWTDWDSRSDLEKDAKIDDVKNRMPEEFKLAVEKNTDKLESWISDGNNGEFRDYLKSLEGKSLPIEFYGRYGKNYFPMKTPDNLKKYSGKMEKDVHFQVKDNLIQFPQESSPFNPKSYLKKVLDTIFGNAGLEYVFVDVERDEDEEIVSITSKGDDKKEVPPLSTTVNTADQADKLAKKLQKRLGEIPGVKYEVESVGKGADRQYKLVITGLSSGQRSKAQPIALDFKTSLKEASDAEMRRVLVRAGVIK
tara:strand:+ start:2162 stop:3148 length:987 start_codon:yes stop_codon:yes gene_type:complete